MKALVSLLTLPFLLGAVAHADRSKQFEVSITNTTANHVFTPTLIVTHKAKVRLFSVGEAASPGLVLQAETGDPSAKLAETQGLRGVHDAVVGGFIPGGNTASFLITAPGKAHLSLTAMLATTNDAFVALNGVRLPKRSATFYAEIYDAGSEANNENCAFIPGPPCAEDSGNARAPEGSEGFVTISNGIHGHGDLSARDLDWNGPGALVTIKRIDHDDD